MLGITLFIMPKHLPMAFKGGTSLSKVFNVIHRFSEDIGITIDYKAFNCADPFTNNISKTKLKILSEKLRANVTNYLKEIVLPYFNNIASIQFDKTINVELANDGETIFIYYPSVLDQKSQYIENSIRLEFGGRNTALPNNTYKITPDIADHVNNLKFPTAEVTVLSPQKTFWEKITLIHYECNRISPREDTNRVSRHWYDIIMLAKQDIGKQAISNIEQLKEVIKIKKAFYDASHAKYDDCLNGKLRLLPQDKHLNLLEKDFKKMVAEKMFYNDHPDFNEVITTISNIENEINTALVKLSK